MAVIWRDLGRFCPDKFKSISPLRATKRLLNCQIWQVKSLFYLMLATMLANKKTSPTTASILFKPRFFIYHLTKQLKMMKKLTRHLKRICVKYVGGHNYFATLSFKPTYIIFTLFNY